MDSEGALMDHVWSDISGKVGGKVTYPEIDTYSEKGGESSGLPEKELIVYDRMLTATEEKTYLAVGKEIKQNKLNLTWTLQNSGGKKVCIIHTHQPSKKLSSPREKDVEAIREKEIGEMNALLDEYLLTAEKSGVTIEKLNIESESIEKGIIQLIEEHNIRKLVMGAAADKHYSRKMTALKSKKAIYVRDNAPPFCQIWFVCNGYLIHTRGAISTPESSASENSPARVCGETNEGPKIATAPSFDVFGPPRLSTGSVSESAQGHPSPSSPIDPHHFVSNNELAKAAGLESLYIEECLRRKELEIELAKVKQELEWVKSHVAELPSKNEGLVTAELSKVKAELEYIKNNVFGELRLALEQKALLDSQVGKASFLLQMMGEKLSSAISMVHKGDES